VRALCPEKKGKKEGKAQSRNKTKKEEWRREDQIATTAAFDQERGMVDR